MTHQFRFVRAGGFDQVEVRTGADLAAIPDLDEKLWVALACPTTGVQFDERTLALIDADNDQRIHAPELKAAIRWACASVKDPDTLVARSSELALSEIAEDGPHGPALLRTAKSILAALGKADQKKLAVADVSAAVAAFEKQPFNGDGIIVEASVDDDALRATLKDVIATRAAADRDKSGADGANKASIEAFFADIKAYAAWLSAGDTEEILPLGEATGDAYAAYLAIRAKVSDYYARARVAAYDPRALGAINGEEKQYLEMAAKDLELTSEELRRLPLAQVQPGAPLPLHHRINPAWCDAVEGLRVKTIEPLLGAQESLSEAEWGQIQQKLAPHAKWVETKAGHAVEKLGAARVRELASSDHEARLLAVVELDCEREVEAKSIEAVEKLVRLNRDLLTLVHNFVSFRDFYTREAPAMFQIGKLFIDRRAADLCVRVNDATKHALLAPLSNAYLLYCDLKNAKGEKMQIAAAITAGDVDNLMVGRNGLFFDRNGVDWDATVTKIIDNPLSLGQAFWYPYKKVLRTIEDRLAKRAAEKEAAQDQSLLVGVEQAEAAAGGVKTEAAKPPGIDVGTVAALGVAVGGIAAALGVFLQAFFGLGIWMPFGILGLILCISGPSVAVAWLKLRKRNLGPILDANGWAVNAQAVINIPLGGSLTEEARLPPGATRDLSDPFAEKPRPWWLYVLVLILIGAGVSWVMGWLDSSLPPSARSVTVMGEAAPAYQAPEADTNGESDAADGAGATAGADEAAGEAAPSEPPAP